MWLFMPQLGTMNYKMILGKHACIVTAEEYETIKNLFLILILTHVSLKSILALDIVAYRYQKRRNPLRLSVFIRQKIGEDSTSSDNVFCMHI